MKNGKLLKDIATKINEQGGRAFFVGGFVRDAFFGKESKDVDIEVFGLPTENLVRLLKSFGQVDEVGKSFGVIKVTIGDLDLDFSLPRREVKKGAGHTAFEVVPDHTMTIQDAVLRRDFTINAIMKDVLTGEIIDLVGGVEDIKNRILRHVSPAFAEDPLRVLRGFQFAARFRLNMAKETIELCRELKSEFDSLARERLFIEWEKFLVKGMFFEHGFKVLQQTGWDECFEGIILTGLNFNTISEALTKVSMLEFESNTQKLIVALAVIEDTFSEGLVGQLTDDRQIVREVKELLKISGTSNVSHTIPNLLISIGLNKKHCSLDTIKKFFGLQFAVSKFDAIFGRITEEKLTPKITGQDLIKKGWNPKVQKEEFGKELKRLHFLQLRDNLKKHELIHKIEKL